MAEKSVNFLK